jgi:hypothetical protein
MGADEERPGGQRQRRRTGGLASLHGNVSIATVSASHSFLSSIMSQTQPANSGMAGAELTSEPRLIIDPETEPVTLDGGILPLFQVCST